MQMDGWQRRDARLARRAAVPAIATMAVLLGCAGGPPRPTTPEVTADQRAPGVASVRPPTALQDAALGDSIFHGRVAGGLCAVCHGRRGVGTARGPRLSDTAWRHGDGSLAAIVAVVTRGVPGTDTAAVPMLPHGGVRLTERQIHAVAAYVHALSGRR